MMRTGALGALCVTILIGPAARPVEVTQTSGRSNPPLMISSTSGRDLFEFYCASCHGRDGMGGGPAASALKVVPPDLTTIARRNNGSFPKAAVVASVTNAPDRTTPAHGSKEMPVWGPIFNGLDAHGTLNRIRIDNIVGYIESIQVRDR